MAELRWFPMVFGIFTISDGWFWHHFTFFSHLSLWCFRPCFLPRTPTDNSPSYYSVHHGVNDIEATWTTQIYRKRNCFELKSWKILKGKSGWQKCETQELVVFPAYFWPMWSWACPGMQRPVFRAISKLQRSGVLALGVMDEVTCLKICELCWSKVWEGGNINFNHIISYPFFLSYPQIALGPKHREDGQLDSQAWWGLAASHIMPWNCCTVWALCMYFVNVCVRWHKLWHTFLYPQFLCAKMEMNIFPEGCITSRIPSRYPLPQRLAQTSLQKIQLTRTALSWPENMATFIWSTVLATELESKFSSKKCADSTQTTTLLGSWRSGIL